MFNSQLRQFLSAALYALSVYWLAKVFACFPRPLVLYCQAFAVQNGFVLKAEEAQTGSVVSKTLMYPSIWWDQIL